MSNITTMAKEFGIEKSEADKLTGALPTILSERSEMEAQYNVIIRQDITLPETAKQARALRLKIRDNRTKGIEVWHKTSKDFFLKGGQFVDAIKRREIAENVRMEQALEEIEKYAETQEQKRLDEVEAARIKLLEPYAAFVPFGVPIRTMSDADFDLLLNGAKVQHEQAQKQREEQERAKAEMEAEKRRAEAIQREAEEREKKQREEFEKIQREEREKQRAIQAELDAARAREEQERKEAEANEAKARKEAERLAKAPIKKQLSTWVGNFSIPEFPGNETAGHIMDKFIAFKKWAQEQVDNM